MQYAVSPEAIRTVPVGNKGRARATARGLLASTIFGGAVLAGGDSAVDLPTAPARTEVLSVAPRVLPTLPISGFLDPQPALGSKAPRGWTLAPVPAALSASSAQSFAAAQQVPPASRAELEQAAPSSVLREARLVPLPVPRPSELTSPSASLAEQRATKRTRSAAVDTPAADTRSFLEKLFNVPASPAPATTYAALGNGTLDLAPPRAPNQAPSPAPVAGTAIYDISTRTVVLPSGETLEAHSGIGEKLDDPRFVHVRMRGATPPGTYALTEREELFHGVRALRLSPVGGAGAIFGRAGLLAHSFMLGPNGDSNGCVSFRDYDRFLQAYLKGEVQRLVVVTGRGRGNQPGILNRLFGMPQAPTVPGPQARDT